MKEQILLLRQQGKSYNEIVKLTGCSKSTVSYHCGLGQKHKYLIRKRKNRAKLHPYLRKLENYLYRTKLNYICQYKTPIIKLMKFKVYNFMRSDKNKQFKFTLDDIINKFGENPVCYLTGVPINIYEPSSYHFDHIVPVSCGGDCSLDNLGICTAEANRLKYNMTPEELLAICKQVVNYYGTKHN